MCVYNHFSQHIYSQILFLLTTSNIISHEWN